MTHLSRHRRDGQYIGIIPTKTRAIPISDSMFGRKSAIHHGVLACQSMSEGLPRVKYPYSQRAVPTDSTSQPMITNLLTHSLALLTFAADCKRVPTLIY
jgi:hypothetical protein